MKHLKLKDLPEANRNKYPIPVTVRVSMITKQKLDKIRALGKDHSETLRKIINEALEAIEV